MSGRVCITGMGIISAIGDSVEESLRSLSAGQSGIGPINHLRTIHRQELPAGEVKHSNASLSALAKADSVDRTTLLGLIAARQALQQAGIHNIREARTGFISSTTVAGMCHTELLYRDFFEGRNHDHFINTHFSGVSSNYIAAALNISDYVNTISTACSSSANAIMLGARLIRHGVLDRVLVGGTDALSKFTLNGFNTLMILDKDWCKPFDNNRKGLNLGEGAAYLVLESEALALKQHKNILAVLSGYSNTNDAHHQTASSPEGTGARLAMEQAMKAAQLSTAQISYINAHGTGTPNNDASEGAAMQTLFKEHMPAFSSTKAYTGHTLAAAAAIEAVISILSLQNGLMFPCLNHAERMQDLQIRPLTRLGKKDLQHIMSNSFGFGGNCSTLIFSKN